MEQLLLCLNGQIPLMGFAYDSDTSSVFFRHIAMISKEKQLKDDQIISETVWLILYILEMFYPTINAIALGQKTLANLNY